MATMKDIAQKAGVSQATVSRVLSNHPRVAPETKAIVMEWVRKLDFEPNRAAQALVSRRTHLIGLVLPDLNNPYFNDIMNHIERICYENGYSVIFCHTGGDKVKEAQQIKSLKAREVEGILIAPVGNDLNTIKDLQASGIETVVITQIHDNYDCVGVNHYEGGRMAGRHLLDRGLTRFTYLGNLEDDKYFGFKDILQEAGYPEEELLNIPLIYGWEHYHERAYDKTQYFLSKMNRSEGERIGVLASNDLTAYGFIKAVQDKGFQVPQEFCVIGFDNTYICSMMHPTLSSIAQPTEDIGKLGIKRLLEKIDTHEEKTEQIVLMPRLMVRDSA